MLNKNSPKPSSGRQGGESAFGQLPLRDRVHERKGRAGWSSLRRRRGVAVCRSATVVRSPLPFGPARCVGLGRDVQPQAKGPAGLVAQQQIGLAVLVLVADGKRSTAGAA